MISRLRISLAETLLSYSLYLFPRLSKEKHIFYRAMEFYVMETGRAHYGPLGEIQGAESLKLWKRHGHGYNMGEDSAA